jgi:hypothetical protein
VGLVRLGIIIPYGTWPSNCILIWFSLLYVRSDAPAPLVMLYKLSDTFVLNNWSADTSYYGWVEKHSAGTSKIFDA